MDILLIDDCPDATAMLTMLLEAQGHRVLVAFSGISGLELARVADPDLVIVEMSLPDIGGLDVIKRLFADRNNSGCGIVALAEIDDLESRRKAIESGASIYFLKSDDISLLLSFTKKSKKC